MPELDDCELFAEFARSESETAFATLVGRYVNLVYSTALRFTGNSCHADEITQTVFIILARKAGKLSSAIVLSGWLYQTTRLTAANFLKVEFRRQAREQEAYMQNILNEPEGSEAWTQIAPMLDEAMGGLGETDRDALVLRFFENKTAAEVAAKLKLTEAAAHKRVNRALEKLRKFFTKRGVSSTTAIIAGTISANSVQAAPVALAKSVTAVAMAKGSIAAVSTMTLVKGTMKTMTWLKIKFTVAVGFSAIVLTAVSTLVLAQQSKKPTMNPTNTVAADDSRFIIPHERVGKVKVGMTEDSVIAALGQPDRKQGEVLIYDQRFGFSVVCSRKKIVGAVFCGDSSGSPDSKIAKAFTARTKEDVGMGSNKEDLVKAFGQPTSSKPWNGNQEQLDYTPLGLTFTLQQNKVIHIIVNLRKAS